MAQDKIYARGSERMDGSQEAFTLRVAQEQKKWRASWVARASKGAACGAAGNGSRLRGRPLIAVPHPLFSSSASRAASTNQRTAGFAGSACAASATA